MSDTAGRHDGNGSHKTRLPTPKRKRWQLLRSGLLNLFHYADEEFWYEDGRLLLRGNNGTGKSRVLALQLPFLLDAELNPTRMEPDRSPSKRPEWNLLLGGKHRDRLGYTWLEFGRVDDDGNAQFFTLGCGLHAVQDRGRTDAWFFTTDRRIGRDFTLTRDSVPHNRARLMETLGEDGVIHRTRGEYCRAVDDRLFRLRDRYRALVDLLIQLRVPQLSRDFDEKRISAQLSDALPPLAPEILEQVAGAMRDLDEQRDRLEELRRSAAAVESFEDHYSGYLRIALKRRLVDFFHEHNKYDRTQRKINEGLRTLADANERFTKVEESINRNRSDIAATEARLQVLRQSPEMDDARRLDEFRQRRDETKRQASESAQRLTEDQQGLQEAKKAHHESADQLKYDRRRAEATLAEMQKRSLPARLAESISQCLDTEGVVESAGTKQFVRIEKAIEQASTSGRRLRQQRECLDRRNNELQRAIDTRGDRERQVEEAEARVGEALDTVRDRRASLCDAWLAWRAEAQEWLPGLIDEPSMREQMAMSPENDVSPENDGSHADEDDLLFESPTVGLTDTIERVIEREREATQSVKANLNAQTKDVDTKIEDTNQKLAELESGVHLPPTPTPTRQADARKDRPGAPFYELVDFAADIPAEEHAAWEAGLEASGLLDAWVLPTNDRTPDDSIQFADQALGDTFADTTNSEPASNMTSVLRVADRLPEGIESERVARLLRSLGCGRGQAETWFDRDGSWQVGAMRGAWTKTAAGHIGITARERRRKEAIATRREELETLQTQQQALMAQLDQTEKRLETLRHQAASRPSDELFHQSVDRYQFAAQQRTSAVNSLREQIAVVGVAKDEVAKESETLAQMADDLGLSDWVNRLDELSERLGEVRSDLRSLRDHLETVRRQIDVVSKNRSSAQQAETRLRMQQSVASEHAVKATAANEAFDTLQQSVGKDVKRILEEIATDQQQLTVLRKESESLQADLLAANTEKAGLEARIASDQETLESHDQDRRVRITGLQWYVRHDLIRQTFDQRDSGDEEQPDAELESGQSEAPWSPTRAFSIAKDWRSRLSGVRENDDAWQNAQNELNIQFKTLEQALLPTGLSPNLRNLDSLQLVAIPYQGVDQSPRDLSGQMNEEVRMRDALITEAERELFEQRLIGDIAQSLHKNIQSAHRLCRLMNEEVQSRPMSTGMRLRFRWHPGPDEADQLRSACRALLKQPAAMSPDEHSSLGEFLQSRIADARRRDDAGTWQEHLAEALDYRTWFVFDIERETDGKWQRLTKRTHGTGSGGERAVSLIMPMLAALAAYYSSADPLAPRMILMDEAYVGIDNEMRAKFMDLLVQFDLDFIMTSEREWGCYPTMPSLAIYHLATRAGIDAILPTRWVWNGRQKQISDVHHTARQVSLLEDDFE